MKFLKQIPFKYVQNFNGSPIKFSDISVSIVIPVRGILFKTQLETCIYYINKFNKLNIEIIIVEEDAISNYSYLKDIDNIKYEFIKSSTLFNKSKCFNKGVSISNYDYISGLDCDMITPLNYFGNGVRCLLEGYDAAFIADDILYNDKFENNKLFFTWNNKRWKDNNNWQFHGGSFFITKEAYNSIGGFYEAFEGYGSEDSEFYKRVHDKLKVSPNFGLPLLHMKHDNPYAKNWRKNEMLYLTSRNIPVDKRINNVKQKNSYLNAI